MTHRCHAVVDPHGLGRWSRRRQGSLGLLEHIDEDTGKTQSISSFMYEGKLVGKIIKVFPGNKPARRSAPSAKETKNKPVAPDLLLGLRA